MNNILHLENNILQIKGATKIVSSTPTQAVVELGEETTVLTGNGIEVKKLNLEENEVCFSGHFVTIKLHETVKKGSMLKRIFK